MTTLSRIPSRLEARQDPAHRLWYAWLDAVDRLRAEPTDANVRAATDTWYEFLVDFDRPLTHEQPAEAKRA